MKLTDNIFYIGAEDSNGIAHSDFSFNDKYASNYNAYIVCGEKNALIDVINEAFIDDYIQKIEEILPVSDIDYLVCNYTGNEFAGSIKKILSINPDIEIVGTVAAIKHIKEMLNMSFKEHIAKDGSVIDLEGETLKFIAAPNLPWPDTMFTYTSKNKMLFSGRMFASYSTDYSRTSMKLYFDTILSSFKPFVHKAAEKISLLDINNICVSNGPVINNIGELLSEYLKWSSEDNTTQRNAAVICPNSWGSTALIAEFISQKLKEHDFNVKIYSLSENYNHAVKEINDYDVMIFGTNTVNRKASKDVLNLISEIDILKSQKKHCFVFGSYGWSGEGLYLLHGYLKLMKLKVFEKPFGVWFNPSDEDYNKLEEYIERFAEAALKEE